ncbi:hypothetical protein HY57_04095 [Dyella japonica A8]|uniref:Uncharacterized protein n=2 Tax=Dyella japonica TaxID=231455 RepID=A0A075JY31_9GAMM|nr:hypothetical protein HY57_04095 [Dyella japonica A8]
MLGLLLLQGMSTPARAGSSVQLFKDDGAPRFSFYLACVSKTVQCEIIEQMFGHWADDRQVTVHSLTPDEAARFPADPVSPSADTPYLITVRYAPEMASVSNSLDAGSSGLPIVSYVANVRVFDTSSGKLVKSMTWHQERMADRDHGSANPYLEAQVRDFLKHLDPSYKPAAS